VWILDAVEHDDERLMSRRIRNQVLDGRNGQRLKFCDDALMHTVPGNAVELAVGYAAHGNAGALGLLHELHEAGAQALADE
jgi:hypothetical protein